MKYPQWFLLFWIPFLLVAAPTSRADENGVVSRLSDLASKLDDFDGRLRELSLKQRQFQERLIRVEEQSREDWHILGMVEDRQRYIGFARRKNP